ncbi:MAG: VanZ family protein [Aquabacterium sp.]
MYATLFPFSDWSWPPGAALLDLLRLPWPRWYDRFDVASNVIAYAPLGAALALRVSNAASRPGWYAVASATAGAAVLSYGLEVGQQFLAARVPSLLDTTANVLGALLGAALCVLAARLGWLQRLASEGDRWLLTTGVTGPLLLVLWPVALLFPVPMPLGLGQIGPYLREATLDLLVDLPGQQGLLVWLEESGARMTVTPSFTALVVAVGMGGTCAMAFACTKAGWHRLIVVALVLSMAVLGSSLSALLSFGPQHAWSWAGPGVWPGLLLAAALACLLISIRPIVATALGLMALAALVTAVSVAPVDPYFAQNLQSWELGRFIRFHGLIQWLSWLWPYAALVWLLGRLKMLGA